MLQHLTFSSAEFFPCTLLGCFFGISPLSNLCGLFLCINSSPPAIRPDPILLRSTSNILFFSLNLPFSESVYGSVIFHFVLECLLENRLDLATSYVSLALSLVCCIALSTERLYLWHFSPKFPLPILTLNVLFLSALSLKLSIDVFRYNIDAVNCDCCSTYASMRNDFPHPFFSFSLPVFRHIVRAEPARKIMSFPLFA